MKTSSPLDRSIAAARELSLAVGKLRFQAPVTHVYNPLEYAWPMHEQYLRLMNPLGTRVLFLGMNPGPWGMAQTGVPFGEIPAVRDWLGITDDYRRPVNEHPKRPIQGLSCRRSEVSGQRLWGLFRQRFGTAKKFFKEHFVANYCPLVFMELSGRNRTPDKLPAEERQVLDQHCDHHLQQLIDAINPEWLVGVGQYAENCLRRVAADRKAVRILHPSPASPAANRGWAEAATNELISSGIW